MISSLKKGNPFSTFPIDLKNTFTEHKNKLDILTSLEVGEKIGKYDNKFYKFSNSYTQQPKRWWYNESRDTTISYFDKDLGEYINFLDKLLLKIDDDALALYKDFSNEVKDFNSSLITGLYNLKKTYNEQWTIVKEKNKIVSKIDSVIMTLIDFKDKIVTTHKANDSKMETLLNINHTLQSIDI